MRRFAKWAGASVGGLALAAGAVLFGFGRADVERPDRLSVPAGGYLAIGDSYSAGYYSYLWADTLSADAFEAFTEAHGPYDKKVAERLREYVFSTGNTVDPAESYRAFRGRDAVIEALMRKRGFGQGLPSPREEGRGEGRP